MGKEGEKDKKRHKKTAAATWFKLRRCKLSVSKHILGRNK